MGIGRLLIFAVLAWLAFRLYRAYRGRRPGSTAVQGRLVRCAQCGVYLPAADARTDGNDAPVCAHHARDG